MNTNPGIVALTGLLLVVGIIVLQPAPGEDEVTATFHSSGSELNVRLEVAETPEERREGLMNREELCSSCGMVFVYPEPGERVFWMKDTQVPLDIIFVSAEKRVIEIVQANPPEPGTPESELERYRSRGEAKYVVELRQGYAEDNGVEPGDRISFEPGLDSTYQP